MTWSGIAGALVASALVDRTKAFRLIAATTAAAYLAAFCAFSFVITPQSFWASAGAAALTGHAGEGAGAGEAPWAVWMLACLMGAPMVALIPETMEYAAELAFPAVCHPSSHAPVGYPLLPH